jgi:hypothetical protein
VVADFQNRRQALLYDAGGAPLAEERASINEIDLIH